MTTGILSKPWTFRIAFTHEIIVNPAFDTVDHSMLISQLRVIGIQDTALT